MPRMPIKDQPHIEPKPGPLPSPRPTVLHDTDVGLKLKILSDSIAKEYLPLEFDRNQQIKEIDVSQLTDTAYIFVDNNGKPTKILAPSVLRSIIEWSDLSENTKQQFQQLINLAKLIPGENVSINENNIISVDIGVRTVNGMSGDVSLTADQLNTYTKDELFTKNEILNILDSLIVVADGGRIE